MLRISQAINYFPKRLGHSWFNFVPLKRLRERLGSKEKRGAEQLVHFGKLLHQETYVSATDGNLSLRLDDHRILATPTAIGKAMMRVRDMVIVNGAGVKLKGSRNVSSEIEMHLTIYKLRPDVKAVVHAHPCTATAFACAGIALDEPLCSELVMTLGSVPLAPYGTTGTSELSESLMPFIPYYNAILMANHGVVAYGKTVCEAYQRMEAVEHFARIVLATRQIGKQTLLDGVKIQKLLDAKNRYSVSGAGSANQAS
ncbi:MAG TPA: class II aldolase/adducin family protein [Candidatus Angelobacter sp.]|jgi:L-fuculose-phosphate aldolase